MRELFQKVPDVDTLNQQLKATDSHVVITIRGIGEMQPNHAASNVTLEQNPSQTDYNERKAYVNLHSSRASYGQREALRFHSLGLYRSSPVHAPSRFKQCTKKLRITC